MQIPPTTNDAPQDSKSSQELSAQAAAYQDVSEQVIELADRLSELGVEYQDPKLIAEAKHLLNRLEALFFNKKRICH